MEVEYTPAIKVLNEANLGILSADWLRWLKAVRTFFIEQLLTPIPATELDISILYNCFGNGKFEPAKKNDVTGQKDSLSPSRPIWLRRQDSNLQPRS